MVLGAEAAVSVLKVSVVGISVLEFSAKEVLGRLFVSEVVSSRVSVTVVTVGA